VVVIGGPDPDADWTAIRACLEAGHCPRLKEVGEEVKNIRLPGQGDTTATSRLLRTWAHVRSYRNALAIIQAAFVQEHFSTATKPETGVVVMNMHKAKGKQIRLK